MVNLLGRGPSFPYNDSETHGLSYKDSLDLIDQSLFILFETPKGSRLMLPNFGSDLYKYRYDPLDQILLDQIRYTITQDIKIWEPRIKLIDIKFLTDPSLIDQSILYISVNYQVISTQEVRNYVYPYKRETYNTENYNIKR